MPTYSMVHLVLAISWWCLAVGALILALFPRLAWKLREAAIAGELNRVVLFNESTGEGDFYVLELKALLYEGAGYKDSIGKRLLKLREVYLALDDRGRETKLEEKMTEKYGRKTLREFLQIIDREIQGMKTSSRIDSPIVYAKEILRFIADKRSEALLGPLVIKASDIETHFRNYPMTMEQIASLLEAVSYGLIYRREMPQGVPDSQFELLGEILRIEQQLRHLIRHRLDKDYSAERDSLSLLSDCLGEDAASALIRRAERQIGGDGQAFGLALIEFLFLDQLKQIMQSKWEIFRDLLPNKRHVNEVFDVVVPVRNHLAHGRRVGSVERKLAKAGILEIESWLEKAKRLDK